MFGKNWKTSLGGLGMILSGIAAIISGLQNGLDTVNWELALASISGGIALLFAKDGNVTGGSTMQETPVNVLIEKVEEQNDAGVALAKITKKKP